MNYKFSIKGVLIIVIMFILFIPLIQGNLKVIKIKPLFGAVVADADTTFSWPGWFSGRFQYRREKYVNDSFGLHEIYIRIRNQLDYTLLKKVDTWDIVIGKDGHLFSVSYPEAYSGADFIGLDSLLGKVKKLKYLQDALAARGKTLLVILAPGRASYEPEYIPDEYRTGKINNYVCLSKLLQGYGLNHIDFNDYFRKLKGKSPYPVFYKYGAHWTAYGCCIAGDSIIKYVEKLRKINMLHPDFSKIEIRKAEGSDIELESQLNLMFNFKEEMVGVPKLIKMVDSTKVKPSLLYVGDSYFWNLDFFYGFWTEFSGGPFFYKYHEVYHLGAPVLQMSDIKLKDEVDKADVIIVEATERFYGELGWQFIDDAYKMLKGEGSDKYWTNPEYVEKLRVLKTYIKGQPREMQQIALKARNNKISVDSMLTLDAIWDLEYQAKK